jgi:hypothetical protein
MPRTAGPDNIVKSGDMMAPVVAQKLAKNDFASIYLIFPGIRHNFFFV